MKKIVLFIITTILIVSCSDDKSNDEKKKEEGIFTKGMNILKSGVDKADSLIIKKPYKYFNDREIRADSIEKNKINIHFKYLRNNYFEYETISNWFESKPPELNNIEGNHYKITKGVKENGKTINRVDFVEKSVNSTFLYFYESEDFFFIIELFIDNETVQCINVRRIKSGFGDQPLYDLVYNSKKELVKEIYQCDVNTSLFEKDEYLYFEFSNEERKNTINLGKYLDI